MKFHLPVSLRSRLVLLNSMVLAAILLCSFVSMYFVLKIWLNTQVDNSLELLGQGASYSLSFKNDRVISQYKGDINELEKQREFIRFIDIKGNVEVHYGPLADLPVKIPEYAQNEKTELQNIIKPRDDEVIRVFTFPIVSGQQIVGYIQTGQSLETVQNTLQITIWILLFLIPLTIFVAYLGSRWIIYKALTPLVDITITAEMISENRLNPRLSVRGEDEVARLAASLNRMLDRLEDAFESYRQFTGDISHELRTPLTIMKGEISLAMQKERDNNYYRQVLEAIDEEVDRLIRLVEQLLLLARAEGSTIHPRIEEFNVLDTLTPLLSQMIILAEGKKQQLLWNIPYETNLKTDPDIFKQIVLNLLENAIKYTPRNGKIKVDFNQDDKTGSFIVKDSGEGIPAEDIAHVFDRYYRANRTQSRGTGLGLAIAKKLTTFLSGDLLAESTMGKGTTFIVKIPR